MQRSAACLATSIFAAIGAGASIHATRRPGASVFEKLLRYTTRPSASSALIGRVSAAVATSSKCSAPYGSSSTMSTCRRAAHSSSRRRFSSEISSPVGFWKFGTT